MDRQTDMHEEGRQAVRQTGRYTDRQTDRQERQAGKQVNRQEAGRCVDGYMYMQIQQANEAFVRLTYRMSRKNENKQPIF